LETTKNLRESGLNGMGKKGGTQELKRDEEGELLARG